MKQQRYLDGIYFRMEREGIFDNICFTDLEPDEMEEVLKNKNDEWVDSLVKTLLQTICKMRSFFEEDILYPNSNITITDNVDNKLLAKMLGQVLYTLAEKYSITSHI